jgi:hypothetical protein
MLADFVLAAQQTRAAYDAWRGLVEAERAKLAALHPVLRALKKALEAEWGATSAKMAEFGFAPARPMTKSAPVKAASAEKARATREAKKKALAALKPST